MRKKRKIWSVILGVLGGMTLVNVVLFIVGVFSPLVFGIVLAAQVLASILILVRIIILTKKLKIKLLERAAMDIPVKNADDPTEIYKILGIPVQYDGDGRVLTIYELLGIVPIFDENGKRVKTIYEELEINPTFSKEGKEIPTVVILKNRANKIAKVKSASNTVLVRKLTPEQREKLILLKMLRQKKEEAEKKGDKDKVEKINNAIKTVKPKKQEKIEPAKLKTIKPTDSSTIKPVVISKGKYVKNSPDKVNLDGIFEIMSSSGVSFNGTEKGGEQQAVSGGAGSTQLAGQRSIASQEYTKTVVSVNDNEKAKEEEMSM